MNTSPASTIFAQLDRELWLVTAAADGRHGGLIATFVNQASIVPELPRVVVGIAKHHHTWGLIEASGAFALHLLGEEHLEWVWRFGLSSGHAGEKFGDLATRRARTGSPILNDAPVWLDCRVEATLDTGDRTVFLAEVLEGEARSPCPPLTARRMVELAPVEKLAAMKEQMARDAALDSAAIAAWRKERRP